MIIEFEKLSVTPTGRTKDGRAIFRLVQDFEVRINISDDAALWIVVTEGFETDFASTPWFLHRIMPPAGKYAPIAVLHDYLYRYEAACPRVLADAIFRVGLKQLGVGRIKRWLMWAAVRLFGWMSYHKM